MANNCGNCKYWSGLIYGNNYDYGECERISFDFSDSNLDPAFLTSQASLFTRESFLCSLWEPPTVEPLPETPESLP